MTLTKAQRLKVANRFIEIISSHGRKFFRRSGEVSHLEVDHRGRVWFVDSYSHARVYTHYRYEWRGFTNGGTLRQLVEALRDYICGKRDLPLNHLGPWPDWIASGDLWGYGAEAMRKVRDEIKALHTETLGYEGEG